MKILVINAGSSSLKYQLIDLDHSSVIAKGICERIGIPGSMISYKSAKGDKYEKQQDMKNHEDAIAMVLEVLADPEIGVIKNMSEIDAVGHRVLHGGEKLYDPILIDDEVLKAIEDCIPLGPLHNPANLMGIRGCMAVMPGVPMVAVFDTGWGMAMEKSHYMYALPYEAYENYKVRRYGFHGTSHRYVTGRALELLGNPNAKVITCHLGNGSSVSCSKAGKCVDTSMGLTPLEGLPMGTRCGSIDPAIMPFLMDKTGMTAKEMDTYMNKKSGMLGISGISNDLRSVRQASEEGDERAQLAYDMYSNSAKKYIGQYIAVMGGVDAIVLTAGVGENCDKMRRMSFAGLQPLGIKIDLEKNRAGLRGEREISTDDSEVRIVIIPTDEEYMIARDTYQLVKEGTLEITELV